MEFSRRPTVAQRSRFSDLGAKVHITPWKEDVRNTRTFNRRCTFGNKGQLQALTMGEIPLRVNVQGKEAPIKVTLKDVVWIPGRPCELLSTGTIRRDGREFVESGTNKSYLRFRKDGQKIPLAETGNILTLSGSVQGNGNYAASAHASFANKKQRLTLKEWRDILGHIDSAAIKHLEKRGFIHVSDTTVAMGVRCTGYRECKSQALSYARGSRSPKTPREVTHTDLAGPFHPDVTGM